MAIKQTAHIIKGLRKDLSDSKHPKEYAIDAKNIRITNREDSTLLSITNEKGTKEITLNNPISGEYLGHTVINDILVLFTKDTDKYYIYKIIPNIDTNIKLFEGKLSDGTISHIEALGVYESKDIQKVYWVDGVNQPRMINIADETPRTNPKEFDFLQELQLSETITVEKSYSSGSFNSGIIQYAFNYYNKNGQETNIVEVTPINYISYEDRGSAPNDYVSNSFKIIINNVDNNFDYLRLYSIHRTSLDAVPSVKLVTDLPTTEMYHPGITEVSINITPDSAKLKFINNSDTKYRILIRGTDTEDYNTTCTIIEDGITITAAYGASLTDILYSDIVVDTLSELGISISVLEDTGLLFGNYTILTYTELNPKTKYLEYIDTGNTGETIDPVELLYKGGEYIIPKTLAQKDGTLFFGNIKLKNYSEDTELENILKEWRETAKFSWKNKVITNNTPLSGYYPFKSSLNNSGIAGFQSRETYRLGVQFQDKTGRWSDPIYFGDKKVDINPKTEVSNNLISYYTNIAELSIPAELVTWARKNNYVKIRPVVVFPQDNEREVIAQGILCPTVFNVKERQNGTCFAQSSWFLRPNVNAEISSNINNSEDTTNDTYISGNNPIYIPEFGAWAEFRHYKPLPSYYNRNAEFQYSIIGTIDSMEYGGKTLTNKEAYINFTNDLDASEYLNAASQLFEDTFYIDQSILTFHSPEIELKKVSSVNDCKIRLKGFVEWDSNSGDIDYTTESAAYDPSINNKNTSYFKGITVQNSYTAARSLISGLFYVDGGYANTSDPTVHYNSHLLYPWQSSVGLNTNLNKDEVNKYSKLKTKKLSNLKYSKNTYYLDLDEDINLFGAIDIFIDNDIYLSAPKNISTIESNNIFVYKGNIDTLITPNISDIEFELISSDGHPINKFNFIEGRPRAHSNGGYSKENLNYKLLFNNNISPNITNKESFISTPIELKYKASPHLVVSLDYSFDENGNLIQNVLPSLFKNDYSNLGDSDVYNYVYGNIKYKYNKTIFNIDSSPNKSYLWLAELYREVPNKFGGNNYENNIWYPAGNSVYLFDGEGNLKSDVYVEFTQGDTFFARFDSLKTYSDDLEATNSVTEIGSFMVETRVNLDARYDRNRGKQSNLVMNPGNFNLFNDVYNQKNNFFNYRIIDKDIADNTEFPNTIVWSKQKFAGADVDVWTNINMASSLDLDGTKGELTKLVLFKNEIFSFQPEAINHILFNSRVQIPTSDGVPIELTNAYKVDGARQLSSVGSSNPLAIKSTDRGIYYMDNITKGIYVFNGQVSESLSDKLGMSSWVKEQDINSYRISYDKPNQDTYFINNRYCLGYSEKLGEFESFFSYEGSDIFNIKDKTYAINSNGLYELFVGEYNKFFNDNYENFYITFTHNENPFNDKIYNTLEFRADTYNYITEDEEGNAIPPYWKLSNNSSFNTIKADNEYQDTNEVSLEFKKYPHSNLKRKFRIWRANIPRDFINKRDRIRNTWANITLKASNPENTKTELHDLVVSYFM